MAHPLAAKWDGYYGQGAPGTAPFDSGRPSSQLVDYISNCLADHPLCICCAGDAAAVADIASKAQMRLPPLEGSEQQELHLCPKCADYKPRKKGTVLEIGCGTGASACWLAQRGYQVTAIDISQVALAAAAASARAAGLSTTNPRWLLQDVFDLSKSNSNVTSFEAATAEDPASTSDSSGKVQHTEEDGAVRLGGPADVIEKSDSPATEKSGGTKAEQSSGAAGSTPTTAAGVLGVSGKDEADKSVGAAAAIPGDFDFIYDCQVYHVLVRDQPDHQHQLPQLLYNLLAPRGLLMILAGNANEPEIGPNVLTAEQLLLPLLAVGFQLVMLHQARFDSTSHYTDVLGKRPLAWWAVLQRPQTV